MSDVVEIDLALQGGGAHGAFTWGVLDRLLDERRLRYVAVSGASAGSMNAVVFAHGLLAGGRAGAQQAMRSFWKEVSEAAHRHPGVPDSFQTFFMPGFSLIQDLAPWGSHAAWSAIAEAFVRSSSPYQWNPFNLNPLVGLLDRTVDFERLKTTDQIRLFISATSVRTGGLRIFRNSELSAQTIMASACLPQLFQAVEIDGEPYWDGGYLGNPSLGPLITESAPSDLLIIQLNPPYRVDPPRDIAGIAGRLNEITFNSSLLKEVRGLALLKQALEEEPADHRFKTHFFNQVRQLRLHLLAADADVFELGTRSKLDPKWDYLESLHRKGVEAADAWLERNWSDLGHLSTLKFANLEPPH
jgi:NTE family protein